MNGVSQGPDHVSHLRNADEEVHLRRAGRKRSVFYVNLVRSRGGQQGSGVFFIAEVAAADRFRVRLYCLGVLELNVQLQWSMGCCRETPSE